MTESTLKTFLGSFPLALQSAEMVKIVTRYFPVSTTLTIPRIGINPILSVLLPPGGDLGLMKKYMELGSSFIEGRYGTPEDLLAEIKKFSDFQGNHQYFGLDGSAHYCHTLKIHKEKTTGKEFIFKNDIYAYMQNYLLMKESELKYRPIVIMLSYFFKSQEAKLSGTAELVPFGEQEVRNLELQLDQVLPKTQGHQLVVNANEFNFENYMKKFKNILPVKLTDDQMTVFIGVLKNLFNFRELGQFRSIQGIAYMHFMCSEMIPKLQKIIDERPEWFLPKEKKHGKDPMAKLVDGIDNLKVTSAKPAIRLLEDSGTFYVFQDELEYAINPDAKWVPTGNGTVGVIELDAALGIMEYNNVKPEDIEFVVIPLERTKHSAVPIPIGDGNFCKSSADAFLEYAKDLFFGFSAFQKKRENEWKELEKEFFEPLYTIFDDLDEVYFLLDKQIKVLNVFTINTLGVDQSAKTIVPVSRKGFTSEDVVNQLKQLSVDIYFKDILDHVDTVYKNVKGKKNASSLRTCDMYDVVEGCFLISFLKKFPKFATFLHSQKACHRVHGFQCEKCNDEKENGKPKQHFLRFFNIEKGSDGAHRAKVVMKVDVLAKDPVLIIEVVPDANPIDPRVMAKMGY